VETPAASRSSASRWSASPWAPRLGAALFVVAAAGAALVRQTGEPSWRTVFAEDGSIYAQQAIRQGPVTALFHSYSGYLQLAPRLVAMITPTLPLRGLAVYFAVIGAIIAALLGLFVFHMSRGWIDSVGVRLALAALFVLMPILGHENTANITNSIWLFASVAPWALVSVQESRRDTVLRGLVAFLAATTTALCIVFVPVAIGWAVIRRTRSAIAVAVTFAVGLAVQGIVILTAPTAARFASTPSALPRIFGVRVLAMWLIGPNGVSSWWPRHGGWLIAGAVMITLAVFAALLPGARRSSRRMSLLFAGLAVLTFLFPVVGRGTSLVPVQWDRPFSLTGARFSVIPLLMLSSSVAVALADPATGAARQIVRIGRPVFIAWAALTIVLSFSVANSRSRGPSWPGSVDAAAARCTGQPPDHVVAIGEDAGNPFAPVYNLELPCSDVGP
jgi:hypothetical protein